jgi:aminoglycoside phosphotransferase
VADRWYDIAVACWSTNWNWHRGDTYEEVFLKASNAMKHACATTVCSGASRPDRCCNIPDLTCN